MPSHSLKPRKQRPSSSTCDFLPLLGRIRAASVGEQARYILLDFFLLGIRKPRRVFKTSVFSDIRLIKISRPKQHTDDIS